MVVLTAAGAASLALRRASAAARHLVWSLALVSLLALPLLSLILPAWSVPILPQLRSLVSAQAEARTPASVPVAPAQTESQSPARQSEPVAMAPLAALPGFQNLPTSALLPSGGMLINAEPAAFPTLSLHWSTWMLIIWLLGVFMVFARLIIGTANVRRMARQASYVTENSWTILARSLAYQLHLRRHVALLKSDQVALPMTWGSWRSVVLLPVEADEWSPDLRHIVLLHELAHVKRRDCLTQMLAQMACACYWFNPWVWSAARRLRLEREQACDDYVLGVGTRASDYASHLLEIASTFTSPKCSSLVTVGMACRSQLEGRVRAILDPNISRRGLNRLATILVGISVACLVLPLAAIRPWAQAAELSQKKSAGLVAQQALSESSDSQPAREVTQPQTLETQRQEQRTANAPASPVTPEDDPQEQSATRPSEDHPVQATIKQIVSLTTAATIASYQREAERQAERTAVASQAQAVAQGQSSELTVDQIIKMKMYDVTPEFIEAMRRQGYDNLTVRQLVTLRIHGVNEEFVKEVRTWGYDKLTINQLVNLRIAGVTPDFIREMKRLGYDNLPIHQLTNLSLHGVTPQFVEAMRKLGFDKLSANELTQMRIHGLTEDFIKEAQNWGYGKLSISQMVNLRIAGITPGYIQTLKRLGYDNLPFEKITQMGIHGVTEDFIKEMQSAGFDKLTADQLIQMRIHGVTPEYIRKMRAAGVKNISVNELIQMRIHGIDTILFKN